MAAIAATTDGNDLHITFDTHVPNPAGLVVTVGDAHQPTPPATYRVPIDKSAGSVVIPGAAADQQTVHVSVGAEDGAASPATPSKPG